MNSKTIRPQDDLYKSVNQEWLDTNEIPDEYTKPEYKSETDSQGNVTDILVKEGGELIKAAYDIWGIRPTECMMMEAELVRFKLKAAGIW